MTPNTVLCILPLDSSNLGELSSHYSEVFICYISVSSKNLVIVLFTRINFHTLPSPSFPSPLSNYLRWKSTPENNCCLKNSFEFILKPVCNVLLSGGSPVAAETWHFRHPEGFEYYEGRRSWSTWKSTVTVFSEFSFSTTKYHCIEYTL